MAQSHWLSLVVLLEVGRAPRLLAPLLILEHEQRLRVRGPVPQLLVFEVVDVFLLLLFVLVVVVLFLFVVVLVVVVEELLQRDDEQVIGVRDIQVQARFTQESLVGCSEISDTEEETPFFLSDGESFSIHI